MFPRSFSSLNQKVFEKDAGQNVQERWALYGLEGYNKVDWGRPKALCLPDLGDFLPDTRPCDYASPPQKKKNATMRA